MTWNEGSKEECIKQLMEVGFDLEDAEEECDWLMSETDGGCYD